MAPPPASRALEPQPRAAVDARDRLGVEAAVRRVLVLGGAVLAHGEAAHRGVGPVVGQAHGDREARAAVGAVDEGIAAPPVGRVEQLGQAVVTDGEVGRDERAGRRRRVGSRRWRTPARRSGAPARARRRRHAPRGAPRRPVGRGTRRAAAGPLDLDEDAVGVVADVAGQAERGGQAVDEGPEPDPLDQTGHPDAEADRRPRSWPGRSAPSPLRRPSVTAASRCIRPKL